MPKALVRHRGVLFVEHAAGVLRDGGCLPVVIVLGARADEVRRTAVLDGAIVVDNPDWASGMGSSLRVGLSALEDCEAAVVLPVDTPGVTETAVHRLARLATPAALARATYDGVPGHPVLLGRDHWAAVAELATGDEGARPYLARHQVQLVPCGDVAVGADVDRPEDLPRDDPGF
ncbi:nucleotidyltransferase family protein [Nocardia goodfellowii]